MACTSPFTPAALPDGAATFEVRVTDAAGNVGNATRSFTVDTVAPTVTITGGPTGPTNIPTPTFTFTTAGSPTTTECRTGTGAFVACTSPFTTLPLFDGAYTFEIRVTDAAGNAGTATRTFSVDTAPPTVSFTGTPGSLTNDNTPTFSFVTGGSPVLVECRVGAAAFVACGSPFTTATIPDGARTFEVRVTDAAGNAASAVHAFTVDTVPPTVSVLSGPTSSASGQTEVFTFSREAGSTTSCRVYRVGQPSGTYVPCSSPQTWTMPSPSPNLAQNWIFEVRAVDAAGNVNIATWTFETYRIG